MEEDLRLLTVIRDIDHYFIYDTELGIIGNNIIEFFGKEVI